MTLLGEIQADAIDPSKSVSDLLRRCHILAFRLRHKGFKHWVASELGGYADEASLPPYRKNFRGQVKAQLSGPMGASANNVEVPLSLLPKAMREDADRFDFYQGVATIEDLVKGAEASGMTSVHTPFPPEIYARLTIYQGYSTVRMWAEMPTSALVGLLDQVRNRALAFTLEIEAENPAAGDAPSTSPPIPVERTNQIFLTQIYGGVAAVGPNARVDVRVETGNLESLMCFLEAHGVDSDDRRSLAEAIQADAATEPEAKPGSRVAAWLGRTATRAARSGARVGEGATAALIAEAVAKFLGIA